MEKRLSDEVYDLLVKVKERVRSYEGGDRPPSPPAWLLKLERDLYTAHQTMTEKVMGDSSYG